MALGTVKWGTLNLNDLTNYVVSDVRIPEWRTDVQSMAQASAREGSIVAFERYPEVPAGIEGWFSAPADTATAVQAARDVLNLALRGENDLRLGFVDERYWRARFKAISYQYINEVGFSYSAEFACLKPFAYANAAASNVVDNGALSLQSAGIYMKSINVPVAGTIHNWPTITIGVPAGGPYGMTAFYIVNTTTGQQYRVTRSFVASQTYTLNFDTQSYVGTAIGTFPFLYTGQRLYLNPPTTPNVIQVWALATSTPTLNVTIAYRNRYQ